MSVTWSSDLSKVRGPHELELLLLKLIDILVNRNVLLMVHLGHMRWMDLNVLFIVPTDHIVNYLALRDNL